MADLGVFIMIARVLRRISKWWRRIFGIASQVRITAVAIVFIGLGVLGVVNLVIHLAVHIAARVNEIQIGDLAGNRQCRLVPAILVKGSSQVEILQISHFGVKPKITVGLLILINNGR